VQKHPVHILFLSLPRVCKPRRNRVDAGRPRQLSAASSAQQARQPAQRALAKPSGPSQTPISVSNGQFFDVLLLLLHLSFFYRMPVSRLTLPGR
jgi:hypothetical protein